MPSKEFRTIYPKSSNFKTARSESYFTGSYKKRLVYQYLKLLVICREGFRAYEYISVTNNSSSKSFNIYYFFEYLCRATGNILKVYFLISLFKFCDSCNLCLYYGLFIVLQQSVVHLRKSQVHSYQRHGNFVTAKRTSLLAF